MRKLKYIVLIVFLYVAIGCLTSNKDTTPIGNANRLVGISLSCDQMIDKQFYQICYSYFAKGPLQVKYTLSGALVDKVNIETRPDFYIEPTLSEQYYSTYDDYTHSGYDRGHLASDASFDYDFTALKSTYTMANIVPQVPTINRHTWADTEKEERRLANTYGTVDVIINVEYNSKKRIGINRILVPTGFSKKIFNVQNHFEACYYYKNQETQNTKTDTLDKHLVKCN